VQDGDFPLTIASEDAEMRRLLPEFAKMLV
jgi:hypothetical protein